MNLKVLGISTSPRSMGNSDVLLRSALSGAESAAANTEYIRLADYQIGPCIECNSCYVTGRCRLRDDYQQLLEKILEADRLIFATPVFYMTVCAQAKTLIDRGQCLWAQKYILRQDLFDSQRDRRAMVIAVGGSRSKKQFECIRLTMSAYFDSLQMRYVSSLFVSKIDDRGEIDKHPEAIKEAYRLGSELAASIAPPPEKPVIVELI